MNAIRAIWIETHLIPEHPRADKGHIDLTGMNLTGQRAITLNGEWEFYPNLLLTPQTAKAPESMAGRSYLNVPGNWGAALPSSSGPPMFGYASYRLLIHIDPMPGQGFGIRIPSLPASAALYVNGKLRMQSGHPAADPEETVARNVPFSAFFTVEGSEIEVIIQAANYANSMAGGIMQPVKFGGGFIVDKEETFSRNMQLAVVVVLIVHILYAALLLGLGIRQKSLVTLTLLVISAVLMVLLDDDKLLLVWLPISYEWGEKLYDLTMLLVPGLLLHFFISLMPESSKKRHLRTAVWIFAAIAVLVLSLPLLLLQPYVQPVLIVIWLAAILFPWVFLRDLMKEQADIVFLMMGAAAVANSAVWEVIKNTRMPEINFYPFDLLLCFLAFAAFWFKRYIRTATETEKLAWKLKQAMKRKDDFLTSTSHELRNPLHGMIQIAQTVLEREKASIGQKSSSDMDLLISVGRRMSFLLNDLLDLTRLQDRGIRLQLGSVKLQAVASGVIDLLRFMTEGKQVRLIVNIPDAFPAVQADENRLIQIVFNLLHNAIKFTNEGSITVEAELEQGRARIRIMDTGIGMDPATLERVLLPYEQGDPSITAISDGNGLGLSISRQLLELHGSALEAVSSPGAGTVFSFTLPPAASFPSDQKASLEAAEGQNERQKPGLELPMQSKMDAPASPAASGHWTKDRPAILVVDDDPVNLTILKDILTAESYDMHTATSAVEALSILETKDWDLIMTDVRMPHMSGYELAKVIRQRFSHSELPLLLLSAGSGTEDVQSGFAAGANDYVTKPLNALELKSRVLALTTMKRSTREHLRMEAAFLQAQIQPHFLFNTLNSIGALSEIDTLRMRALLAEFGHYLRASFNSRNADRLVPLRHELDLVRSYLFIEKERFEERLNVVWEIDEGMDLMLPPLSIQPLVENAVKHGVLARVQGGQITIRITEFDEYAEIAVTDDGVGIEAEELVLLLQPDANLNSGIGLRHIDRRLKQLYGQGLVIQSTAGRGTTVMFRVLKKNPLSP
ncbi:ATP-binding protein [Paenibacillus filicis]